MANPASPDISGFHDPDSGTISYLVACPLTRRCAVIDAVLGFDPVSGRTDSAPADRVIAAVRERGLACEWVLETHVHADHLSAAPYVQRALGGAVGIGAEVETVRRNFGKLFNFGRDAPAFDRLFADGDGFAIGALPARAMATPGHTPDSLSYLVGAAGAADPAGAAPTGGNPGWEPVAAFVGDTLFMPDSGTARCDFPGGDAALLYRSINRLLSLPPGTRLYVCHDYKAPGRDAVAWETDVAAQRAGNIHVHEGTTEPEYVALRRARDATLALPRLMLPSVQVNLRAGRLPEPEDNGVRYIRIPIDPILTPPNGVTR
ncbi:MBL fold metallo-hydrolase [Roseomonas sp. NAR14]|uniref:MBL fold metallo-hydrolase n=1 Tax=Roseomonas acroporae TaxID=2937791 RepID=A0A9X1YB04_9PROT|nr:MBL fold metallo-hydrolase [Roseomonas acroporae]MCK8786385.1 MBL fold metallo-hydrolase [Roseomonas acroporae]